jgi:hypothetical protein
VPPAGANRASVNVDVNQPLTLPKSNPVPTEKQVKSFSNAECPPPAFLRPELGGVIDHRALTYSKEKNLAQAKGVYPYVLRSAMFREMSKRKFHLDAMDRRYPRASRT